jgi:phosphopantetheinyl transferase
MKTEMEEQTVSSVTVAEAVIHEKSDMKLRLSERLAGHQAARRAAQKAALNITDTSVAYFESGAPFFLNEKSVNLSISHSGKRAVAAIAQHSVGIDIEKIRNRSKTMLTHICATSELNQADCLTKDTKLTALWTIKESVMKAARKGLSWPPKKVLVLQITSTGEGYESSVKDPEDHIWQVNTTIDPRGYVISIAIPWQKKK